MRASEIIAIVTRATRFDQLKSKKATAGAAAFVLEKARMHERARRKERAASLGLSLNPGLFQRADEAADFSEYQSEGEAQKEALKRLRTDLELGYPVTVVDRELAPNFDFHRCLAVVVVGPDGLVANTAKYVGEVPIVAVNPDPTRNDGVLLPFQPGDARAAVQRVIAGKAMIRTVTLAEVSLNDGQRMLAFNDFFIGCRSHASARYTIHADGRAEAQSSSGVLVSTGAGSTGWLSSVFNMVGGICSWAGKNAAAVPAPRMTWDEQRLLWVVREPFASRHSLATMVCGQLESSDELVLESLMPDHGVIFSDGIENDYLDFSSGTIATFRVSEQRARLVTKGPTGRES